MNWQPPKPPQLKDSTTGTIRTATNVTILTYAVLVLNWVFKWNITLEDLLPFTPVIPVGYGIFYRTSLYLSKKWTWFGYIFFANSSTPSY